VASPGRLDIVSGPPAWQLQRLGKLRGKRAAIGNAILSEGVSMRNAKMWLCGLVVGMAVAGTAALVGAPSAGEAQAPRVGDHWRHYDGHWSYWHEADKRWYYTDGANWFYTTGEAWAPYRFDKAFGREGFERGEYRVPGEGATIVVPRHGVWRPR
jgi:hypothetical protein